jgi:hypothetical protein
LPREQFYTHLVTTLPEAGATLVTRRAVRTVLSSMLQMAWEEQYRHDNPVKTIELKKVLRSRCWCPPTPSGTDWRVRSLSAPQWRTHD